jgi:hypothetical protein
MSVTRPMEIATLIAESLPSSEFVFHMFRCGLGLLDGLAISVKLCWWWDFVLIASLCFFCTIMLESR